MKDIKEEIYYFVSTHECIVSHEMENRDPNINVHFTKFGSKAGCRALYDVITMLDEETQAKVLEMMRNKKVVTD